MRSIQVRLLVVLSLVLIVIIGAASWRLYNQTHREIDDLFDAQLAESASLLLAQAGDELDEDDEDGHELLEAIDVGHKRKAALVFQLRDRNGRLLFRSSPRVPAEPLTQTDEGFSDVTVHDRPWRVYATWDRHRRLQIQVAQPERRRVEIAAEVTRDLLLPLLIMLPVSLLAVWIGVRSSLRGLKAVTAQAKAMAPGSLQPLRGPVPSEIEPLVAATNDLLARLDRALQTERRFTADAAHELRTPLAAIRAQAEAAIGAPDRAANTTALKQLLQGVDRAARSVEQLLTLARLDPQAPLRHGEVSLHAVAQGVLASAAQRALTRKVELELAGDPALTVSGDPDLLSLLVRNLVDNAIRFAPAGTTVRVFAGVEAGQPVLSVTDEGAGVPPEYRTRIFDRFFRVTGAGDEGSGLGLAIVKQIAERHGAQVAVENNPAGRGAQFHVRFPSPKI